jgi:predicted Zn-dependent protease with MMP-like domain
MTRDYANLAAPSLADVEALALAARDGLPEPYRSVARGIAIIVEDFADEETLEAMQIEDPFDLTGLYDGIPLTEKSVMDQPERPDTIWLFRRPILDEWSERTGEPLGTLVAHVLIHELAHHFGWSDEDIARVDPWWE